MSAAQHSKKTAGEPAATPLIPDRHVLLFFFDGVGLGSGDPEVNPFVSAQLPHLNSLLGEDWYTQSEGRLSTARASLIPTDPNLAMPGRPQSATGQAAILTGRNVPALIGEHYGPKPNQAVRDIVLEGSLFSQVVAGGGEAALLTPYPQGYFDAINSGKRRYSAVPQAATDAGLALMTATDLRDGRAVSPGFTGQAWHDYLGYTDIPLYSLHEAGQQIAKIARHYQFSFFEHWPSDRAGHRGPLAEAVSHLEMIDGALGGLFDAWDEQTDLLIITSDHGNIEEKNHRLHTRNPVPTIIMGPAHADLAAHITSLIDIATVVRHFLGLSPLPEFL